MIIESAHSPIWVNQNHTAIDLMVKFKEFNEELPFTATLNDNHKHSKTLFDNAINGVYGVIVEYTSPVVSLESLKRQAIRTVKQERTKRREAPVNALNRSWCTDQESRLALDDAISLAEEGDLPLYWRDADHKKKNIDSITDLIAIKRAITRSGRNAALWAGNKIFLIQSATTVEELNVINLTS